MRVCAAPVWEYSWRQIMADDAVIRAAIAQRARELAAAQEAARKAELDAFNRLRVEALEVMALRIAERFSPEQIAALDLVPTGAPFEGDVVWYEFAYDGARFQFWAKELRHRFSIDAVNADGMKAGAACHVLLDPPGVQQPDPVWGLLLDFLASGWQRYTCGHIGEPTAYDLCPVCRIAAAYPAEE